MKDEQPQPCRGGNCGHTADEHQDGGGRCRGQSYDPIYGTYRCLCPYYSSEPV